MICLICKKPKKKERFTNLPDHSYEPSSIYPICRYCSSRIEKFIPKRKIYGKTSPT